MTWTALKCANDVVFRLFFYTSIISIIYTYTHNNNVIWRVSRWRNFLFPPAKFSLQNSEISTTAAHSSCFGNSHRRLAVSIVLISAIV